MHLLSSPNSNPVDMYIRKVEDLRSRQSMNNSLARGIYKVKTITYNDQLMDFSAFTNMNQKITNMHAN